MNNSRSSSFDYVPPENGYDEMVMSDGSIRPAFNEVVKRFNHFGPEELKQRRRCIRSVLTDNDLVSSARERKHSERLDALPLIITPSERQELEAGLKQRSRLFNMLAWDLYGEQKLWKSGILPPALLHANPDFLRAVWGSVPPSNIWIHLMGCDVIRTANGFCIIGDHLQTPEGLGKALENRLAVGRAFPAMFRDLYVERLAGFFKTLLNCFGSISQTSDKRIVLLATSPEHEKRNEDAVLARYLGLQLVENDDLAVRKQHVYLKTLEGLKQIDVIFRRIDDGMCDPLELRIDSGEGASGLISSMRAGNVSVINAIGSGALEAPLFRAFLPEICRELLGEELLLSMPKCHWLGEKTVWEGVQENPENLIFRPAFGKGKSFDYSTMTPVAQLSLLDRIGDEPQAWIAEPRPEFSTAPVWHDGKWCSAKVSMRMFSVTTPDTIQIMPGALGFANIPTAIRNCTKDVWVLADQPVEQFSLLVPTGQPVPLSRAGGDLPSRSANNLYLLGGHIETAEFLARLARGIALRLTDQAMPEAPELSLLLQAGAEYTGENNGGFQLADPENALWTLVMKTGRNHGIQHELKEVRRLATQLRDRISEDTWHLIHNFGSTESTFDDTDAATLLPFLGKLITDSIVFAGLASENMTRGYGWRFMEMGRKLERCRRYLQLLSNTLGTVLIDEQCETRLLQVLLGIGDCSMTYHRRYGGRLQPAPVIDLFLCDETNPRSVAFQIMSLNNEAKSLPHAGREGLLLPLDRELLQLMTELRLMDVYQLAQSGPDGQRTQLIQDLSRWMQAVDRIAELLTRDYLNHAPRRSGSMMAMATEV